MLRRLKSAKAYSHFPDVSAIRETRDETAKEMEVQRKELKAWREAADVESKRKEETVNKIAEGVKAMGDRLMELEKASRYQTTQSQAPPPTHTDPYGPRQTYAKVTAAPHAHIITSKGHATAQARGEEAERQIILSSTNKKGSEVAAGLRTETELLTKADMTLKLMLEDGEVPPTLVEFVGAFKTRTGAVIYTLNTEKAAKWIRSPDILRLFKEKFGGVAEARAKLFNVIAYYVPVIFDPESEEAKRRLEDDNRLRSGSLVHARYIKPTHRRSPNQKVAHVILGFANRADANDAIDREWMNIEGKRGITVEKLAAEPRRCYKCQNLSGNHTADKCPEKKPKCARCAEDHSTDLCENPSQLKCANCRSTDHGAGSRGCPAFKQSVEEYKRRNPEASYRYYPVLGVTHTLELLDGTYAPNFAQEEEEEEGGVEDELLRLGPATLGEACPQLLDWAEDSERLPTAASRTVYYTPSTTIINK